LPLKRLMVEARNLFSPLNLLVGSTVANFGLQCLPHSDPEPTDIFRNGSCSLKTGGDNFVDEEEAGREFMALFSSLYATVKADAKMNPVDKAGEMKTLQRSQQAKRTKRSEDRRIKSDDDLIDLFPLPRYFQVHFQHVHENTHDLQSELVELKDYVAKVDEKLERLMALLRRPPEHVL